MLSHAGLITHIKPRSKKINSNSSSKTNLKQTLTFTVHKQTRNQIQRKSKTGYVVTPNLKLKVKFEKQSQRRYQKEQNASKCWQRSFAGD